MAGPGVIRLLVEAATGALGPRPPVLLVKVRDASSGALVTDRAEPGEAIVTEVPATVAMFHETAPSAEYRIAEMEAGLPARDDPIDPRQVEIGK